MFFLLLCLLLYALLATGTPFDTYGWLMVVGLAWFCGFLDGRRGVTLGKGSDKAPLPGDNPVETVSYQTH